MRTTFQRLYSEVDGAIVSAEVMLVASILVIGAIVGLKSVRDSVVTELADAAQAVANVDQSYWYSGAVGHHTFTRGGFFRDLPDFCDTWANTGDAFNSKCVVICSAPANSAGPFSDGGFRGGFGF